MTLQRDVAVGVGLLAALVLLVALGSVGLLARMGPAIEQILERNGRSLEAGEDMLVALALLGERPASADEGEQFRASLARTRTFITEAEEEPVVGTIERLTPSMLEGDMTARAEVARALRRLGEINRAAMRRADDDARRLGSAGAWACVFLGLAGLLASIGVSRRLRHRAVEPLTDLHDAVEAYVHGNHHRRARSLEACDELKRLSGNVNRLLDAQAAPRLQEKPRVAEDDDRAVLLHLLDESAEVKVIADDTGEILAANKSALAALSAEGGSALRAALRTELGRARDARSVATAPEPGTGPAAPAGEPTATAPERLETADGEPRLRIAKVVNANRWIGVLEAG